MRPEISKPAVSGTAAPAQREKTATLSVAIPYVTREGRTAQVAEFIADVLRKRGLVAIPVDLKRFHAPDLEGYDAVIVGGSIHMGKHDKRLWSFVKKNRGALERLPSAFFSVSLAAHQDDDASRAEVKEQIEGFARETGWRPARIAIVAGALLYTQYGFIIRRVMKRIVRDKGNPDLDTSRDYDYTDWEAVKQFAEEFAESLAPKAARPALEH